jgi:hypothetical protein
MILILSNSSKALLIVNRGGRRQLSRLDNGPGLVARRAVQCQAHDNARDPDKVGPCERAGMQVVGPGLVKEQHNVRDRHSHSNGRVHQRGRPVFDDQRHKNIERHIDCDVEAHER